MAAGDSDVSICNTALILLGERVITSRTDNTKTAQTCNSRYDPVRRAVLRGHPWRCARSRLQLAATAAAPSFGYSWSYQKPADYIRAFDLPAEDQPKWEVEGDLILSNIGPPLNLTYVFDLYDPTRMDALLVDTIARALAVDLCMSLTQSVDKQRMAEAKLADIQALARSISAQEASPAEWDDDIWLRSRR